MKRLLNRFVLASVLYAVSCSFASASLIEYAEGQDCCSVSRSLNSSAERDFGMGMLSVANPSQEQVGDYSLVESSMAGDRMGSVGALDLTWNIVSGGTALRGGSLGTAHVMEAWPSSSEVPSIMHFLLMTLFTVGYISWRNRRI